jgi:hypothetical protein
MGLVTAKEVAKAINAENMEFWVSGCNEGIKNI